MNDKKTVIRPYIQFLFEQFLQILLRTRQGFKTEGEGGTKSQGMLGYRICYFMLEDRTRQDRTRQDITRQDWTGQERAKIS